MKKLLLTLLVSLALLSCGKKGLTWQESHSNLKGISMNILLSVEEQKEAGKTPVYPSWEVATGGMEINKEDYVYHLEGKTYREGGPLEVISERKGLNADATYYLQADMKIGQN